MFINFSFVIFFVIFIIECLEWIVLGFEDSKIKKGNIFVLEENIVFFILLRKGD